MSETVGMEILLVEDKPHDLELTLHAFGEMKLGNHIQIARDGVEALDFIFCRGPHSERLIEHGPKLVLLDLQLPRLDGFEVLKSIKGDPRTRQIPVVVLTSSKDQSDLLDTYQLGINSYIVKPVDSPQFIEAVKKLGMYWLLVNQLPER